MGAAVWRWPSGVHLASWTPEAAVPLPQRQQGILGWRARVAPSATPPSASRSSCWKGTRHIRLVVILIYSFGVTSSRRGSRRVEWEKRIQKESQTGQHHSLLLPCTTLKKSTVIVRVFASICVWAGEGWERNLALDFMPDWPIFKSKKSDIPFLYALCFLSK